MAVITFSTDGPSERALIELTADGSTVSEVIRQALVDAARQRRREQMRWQSVEASRDPADFAESRQVLAEMCRLRAR